MKKLIVFVIAATLVLSPTFSVFSGGNGNGNSSGGGKDNPLKTEKPEKPEKNQNGQSDLQKTFKQELNQEKKLVSQSKQAIETEKLSLESQYQELLAAGSTAEAEAILLEIQELDKQLADLQGQIKQLINERYMVAKSTYTAEELSQFENAAALIERMYADANVLDLGSIIIKDNIIKLDAPAYIKGGRTIIPVRAITEELGAAVTWDPDTKSATIAKDGIEIVLTMNSKEVLVNGVTQQIDVPAEVTNGKAYVPLKFIVETFGLYANWDQENEVIDIGEENPGETPTTSDGAIDVTDGAIDVTEESQTTSGAID
ncbi:copper amine oxidase N-terminal domain-containing protein [Sinanaerobacter chloroacetimidivorans]|uniref:Copper amine oxidase-like N-terminal domain-containing protein n=1 Tax=Sinanaerobacter chloroacetimidivorans TaxID=2818044 RepID=A0A8J8B150_9FIRM|nr:stalk domain-containing protein [Sinanaerobacter chloroacetimidivorans]MBR0597397.1 hypothetical protein [Sinanaerobacter chloroacetimidivorans]